MLRFIAITLRRCSSYAKEIAYTAFVRPVLEYCFALAQTDQLGLSEDIEIVQSRADRFVLSRFRRDSLIIDARLWVETKALTVAGTSVFEISLTKFSSESEHIL